MSDYTIQSDFILKNFKGENLKDEEGNNITLGKALSNILLFEGKKKFDHLKAYGLAQKLYNNTTLDLDKSDFTRLKELLNEGSGSSLICGQILEYFETLKEKK